MDYLINRIGTIISCLEKINLDLYFMFCIKINFQMDQMFKYKNIVGDHERFFFSFFRVGKFFLSITANPESIRNI